MNRFLTLFVSALTLAGASVAPAVEVEASGYCAQLCSSEAPGVQPGSEDMSDLMVQTYNLVAESQLLHLLDEERQLAGKLQMAELGRQFDRALEAVNGSSDDLDPGYVRIYELAFRKTVAARELDAADRELYQYWRMADDRSQVALARLESEYQAVLILDAARSVCAALCELMSVAVDIDMGDSWSVDTGAAMRSAADRSEQLEPVHTSMDPDLASVDSTYSADRANFSDERGFESYEPEYQPPDSSLADGVDADQLQSLLP